MPTRVVKSGTIELKIDVIPLSSSVCAKANKKGGKNELSKPAAVSHFQSLLPIVRKLRYPSKNKKREARTTRRPPTCKAVKPISALLISIKDDPQINDSKMR